MDVINIRRGLMLQGQNGSKNYFNAHTFWRDGYYIGDSHEGFWQYDFIVPNGTYIISTNCPNNTATNVASVMARNDKYTSSPTSGGSGVFDSRPRTLTTAKHIISIAIRCVSGGYLAWDEQTFAPYYIKIEEQ